MKGICEIQNWPGSSELVVTLPGDWGPHLASNRQDQVTLRAGNRKAAAHVVYTDEAEVQMTQALRSELCLPLGKISVKAVNGELRFGPFVGLYALPAKTPGKPFGELTALFQDMMPLAEQAGVSVFVFVPGEINWGDGIVSCYVYKPREKHWVRTKRPLPDLVMPKIMGQPPQWRDLIRRDLLQIAKQVPYGNFSNATGHKWEVHLTLEQNEATRRFLPETILVRTPRDVDDLLERHRIVYLKPSYGTQGKRIYRLSLPGQGQGVRIQYMQNGRTLHRRLQRPGSTWQRFLQQRFCAGRAYLAQQGIDLLADRGVRPVDFRWLMQKDGANVWHVTARIARVGGSGSITTNLHTGGRAVLADDLLQSNGFADAAVRSKLLDSLDEAAHSICRVLEAKAGRIGELGIDFGVTAEGRIYLIEVNPRPGRQMLKQTSPGVRALSLLRNLEYAKYTTGF
ncbi:YheC/D-like protein [Tumebacillus sp. BK434]|uniref:YheC/YheD family endospore coat-associated protein n=1 Tax=Tumebacillus sp. BK434 TaxID=2512169 RepID=UPI00105048FC|nr:YheC/YheD family protein [Tumebacillus sp. BK434]TCP58936.1 YheC/D-like protein [Tumebacillus sp. BK434]